MVMVASGMGLVLYTDDLARSVAFYTARLGWRCVLQQEGFARLRLGGAGIMLALPNAHVGWNGPALTGAVYLYVDDVDALWVRLRDQVAVVYPVETMAYGLREFGVLDDNGYQLSFAQRVE